MPPANEAALRKVARHALDAGKIPRRRPDRTWGGPGIGAQCAVCQEPIPASEMEYEVEFARDGQAPGLDKFHVHLQCAAVWELERNKGAARPAPRTRPQRKPRSAAR
jgi:hypothetical protein